MTATPIPRTLALTLYGDLDNTILDEMPPGRQPITTHWFTPAERERAYSFVRAQVDQGRQVFVMCPLIESKNTGEEESTILRNSHGRQGSQPSFAAATDGRGVNESRSQERGRRPLKTSFVALAKKDTTSGGHANGHGSICCHVLQLVR
jgi:hypothetical protein